MEETTTPAVTTRSAGIRYGLILAVVSIAYFLIFNMLGVDVSQGPGSWGRLVYCAALIFLAHKYFKDNGSGFMSFGEGFGISFWMALISSVISSVFTYIYVTFIDTGFIQQMMDRTREAMEEKGSMSEDQIDQAMNITAKFMTPGMLLVFGVIFGIIIISIVGLVVTIFTQKKNPEPFV
ncbi:MAG: DUF4199 domain-containing protein [Bacteroidetes bacterium]|nr:DUF4199 domain-containing protein [Bacteroidota bacterium]